MPRCILSSAVRRLLCHTVDIDERILQITIVSISLVCKRKCEKSSILKMGRDFTTCTDSTQTRALLGNRFSIFSLSITHLSSGHVEQVAARNSLPSRSRCAAILRLIIHMFRSMGDRTFWNSRSGTLECYAMESLERVRWGKGVP